MRFSLRSRPGTCGGAPLAGGARDDIESSAYRFCWWLVLVAIMVLASGCRGPRQIRTSDYADAANQIARSMSSRGSRRRGGSADGPRPGRSAACRGVHLVRVVAEPGHRGRPQEGRCGCLSGSPGSEPSRPHVRRDRIPRTGSDGRRPAGSIADCQSATTLVRQVGDEGRRRRSGYGCRRAQLAAMELEVIEQVKRAYYELYFIQQAIRITEDNRKLLLDFVRIADSKYRTGKASQQDVLRAQVEVSNLDNQLIRLRQQLDSSQAKLARLLHVSPDTPVRALEQPPQEQIPQDLQRLYQQAIAGRPELHAQLAAVQRDRRNVDLARLEYYPDLTAGVTWIGTSAAGLSPVANGDDPLLLAFSVNVPIYRQRLDAGVREAESRVVASTRQYDSLRDRTAESVKDLYAQATSQYDLVKLFRDDIIPKSEQTLEVSQAAYQVGDVDFLQLIDNWQQLLRFQIAYHRLESQLQQTLAMLERVVGGQLQTVAPTEQDRRLRC